MSVLMQCQVTCFRRRSICSSECPVGTYQPETGKVSSARRTLLLDQLLKSSKHHVLLEHTLMQQVHITDASAGYIVSSIGQSSQEACPAGTYQPDTERMHV